MEKLGGGGHLTAAACVLNISSMPVAVKRLKAAIDEVLKEEDFKKVILQEDVRGKGRKGDILEFATEQANALLLSGAAIEATADNIRMIEQEKAEAQKEAEKQLREIQNIKSLIEKEPLEIYVELDDEGQINELVNSKKIANALEKKIGKKIDRRKIIFTTEVKALGLYEAQVKLSSDIFATIVIHLVEKTSK